MKSSERKYLVVDSEVYNHLSEQKQSPDESFGNVVRRLLGWPPLNKQVGWPKGKKRTGRRGKMAV